MFDWLRELIDLRSDWLERKYAAQARLKKLETEQELDLILERTSAEEKLNVCQSCETLKIQLSLANQEKKDLLDRLLFIPKVEPEVERKEFKPVGTKNFATIRAELEARSRREAELIKQKKLEIASSSEVTNEVERLEAEMGI